MKAKQPRKAAPRKRSPYETRASPHRPDCRARPHRIVPFVAGAGARKNPIGRISSNEETAACRNPHLDGSHRVWGGLPFRVRHRYRNALVRLGRQRACSAARGRLGRIRIQPRCLRRRRQPARREIQNDARTARRCLSGIENYAVSRRDQLGRSPTRRDTRVRA